MDKGKEKNMVTTNELSDTDISVDDNVKDIRNLSEEKQLTSLYGELKTLIPGNDLNVIKSFASQIARIEQKKTIKEKMKKDWHLNRTNKTNMTGILLTKKMILYNCESKLTLQKLKK